MNTIQTMLSQPVGYGFKVPHHKNFEKYQNSDWQFASAEIDLDIGFVRSIYHHLSLHLEEDATMDGLLQEFIKEHCGWDSVDEVFAKWRKHTGVRIFTSNIDTPHLDGSILYAEGDDKDGVFVLVSTHNGFDMRSGFSDPHFFRINHPIRGVVCTDALPPCSGGFKCDFHGHEWYTYDGETFYCDNVVTPMFPDKYGSKFEMSAFQTNGVYTMPTCIVCQSPMTII